MKAGATLGKQLSHKPIRVEKELHLLKNLPKEYKVGKRETSLGTLLYVISFSNYNQHIA